MSDSPRETDVEADLLSRQDEAVKGRPDGEAATESLAEEYEHAPEERAVGSGDYEPPAQSVASHIAQAWTMGFSLELDREAMSYLAGIHALLSFQPEPFLGEEQLRSVFGLVSELSHGDPGTLSARATRAIARLREQHLLIRSDLGGLAKEGEYGLSQLGKALAEWVLIEESLTGESLEAMMARIRADLLEVKAAAEAGGDAAHWHKHVLAPLKFTVSGLMTMIDRRSRGLDRDQEVVREKIGELLEAGWFDAIDSCEALLENVTDTLGELHRTLMSETESAAMLLSAVMEAADRADRGAAREAAGQVQLQLERVSLWGEMRHRAWSDYYQSVHEFIRSVVRVDRDRALRSRLRESIQAFGKSCWTLLTAEQIPYRRLRDIEPAAVDNRVGRLAARHAYGLDAMEESASEYDALLARLEERLGSEGRLTLLEALQAESANERQQYGLIAALVPWMAQRGNIAAWREIDWVAVSAHLSVQDLRIVRKESP